MTRNLLKLSKGIMFTIWWCFSLGLFANNLTLQETVKDEPLEKDFIALVQKYIDTYHNKLEVDEKGYVFIEKEKLAAKAINASKISAAAVMISATASSEFLPIVMSAIAALSDPRDPLIVNNFGAMIRALNKFDDSIIALLYAKTLQADSPLILTNLGNSYIDKKIFDKAEVCYREALKYDKDFGSAHEGMARVYINKKDGKRAIDELIKAGKLGFSTSMRKGYLEAKKCGGFVDDSFWEDSQSDDKSDKDDKREDDKLILPDFPRWESRGAFLHSLPNLIKFAQTVMEKGMAGGLVFAAKYHADELMESFENTSFDSDNHDDTQNDEDEDEDENNSNSEDDSFEDIESINIKPSYGQKLFMLELVNDYYIYKIEQEYKKNIDKRKRIDDTFQKALMDLKDSPQAQKVMSMVLAGDIGGAKTLARVVNTDMGIRADAHFVAWRDMTLDTYGGVKSLLYEYWKTANQVTGDIYDQDAINYFNDIRELTVYSSLLPIAMDFTLLPTSYTLADYILPIVQPEEDLREYYSQPVSDIEMTEKEEKECAIKGKKISFGLGPVSFGVTCDTWELELLQGLGAAVKHNFKTGAAEISVLAGVKTSAGGVEFGVKESATFKFNKEGDFIGWSSKSEAGGKVGIGPLSVSQNLEYSSDIGAITTPKASILFGNSTGGMGIGGQ